MPEFTRDKIVPIRFALFEYDMLKSYADRNDISISEAVRRIVLNEVRDRNQPSKIKFRRRA